LRRPWHAGHAVKPHLLRPAAQEPDDVLASRALPLPVQDREPGPGLQALLAKRGRVKDFVISVAIGIAGNLLVLLVAWDVRVMVS
jgi:hypothetical protein